MGSLNYHPLFITIYRPLNSLFINLCFIKEKEVFMQITDKSWTPSVIIA